MISQAKYSCFFLNIFIRNVCWECVYPCCGAVFAGDNRVGRHDGCGVSNKPFGLIYQLGDVGGIEFFHDAAPVGLHGVNAEIELGCYAL